MDRNTLTLLAVIFVSHIGIALPYPVLAPLLMHLPPAEIPGGISVTIFLGLVLAAYPLGQFLGSPILGKASDRFGRRQVLFISCIGGALGYLLGWFTLVHAQWLAFLLSRLFCGFMEGNIGVIRAAFADRASAGDKARLFGYSNAALSSGFLLGPLLGGFFADQDFGHGFGPNLPFAVASVLTLAAAAMLLFFYNEKEEIRDTRLDPISRDRVQSGVPDLPRLLNLLIAISFVCTLGFDTYYEFYPVLLVDRWQFAESGIAVATLCLTAAMIMSQIGLVRLTRKISPEINIVFWGVYLASCYVAIVLSQQSTVALAWMFASGAGLAMVGVYLPVYVSDRVPPDKQGLVMGRLMGWRYFGDALVSALGGVLAGWGSGWPICLAALFVGSGTLLFFVLFSPRSLLGENKRQSGVE